MILWGGAPTRSIKLEIKLDQRGASTTLFDPPYSEKAMFTPNELLSGLDMEVCTTLCTFGEDGKSFIITSQYKVSHYQYLAVYLFLNPTRPFPPAPGSTADAALHVTHSLHTAVGDRD